MAMEDYQAAVNDFKVSLEHVRADGSQSEERALKQELKEAEVALKRSKTKDYYKILGKSHSLLFSLFISLGCLILQNVEVSRNCSDAEIKKAYRKQSLLHHPDKVRRSLSYCVLSTWQSLDVGR